MRMLAMGWTMAAVVFWVVVPAAGQTLIVENGTSDWVIATDHAASLADAFAAEELQRYIAKTTGATLAITTEPSAGAKVIALGSGPAVQALDVDGAALQTGEQGYLLRTIGSAAVVIAGGANGGTLYGVYDFLERYAGVRWYAPGVEKAEKLDRLAVGPVDEVVRPGFPCRWTSYTWPGRDGDFMARQRHNFGHGSGGKYGKQYMFNGTCHTYFRYVSPEEFYDTHPEYFSLVGGVRLRDETQLCLTNPELLEIVTQRMLQTMRDNPDIGQHNFSQMDYYNPCQCPACRAINEQYQTAGGTQFWFINQLAERTSKEFPDTLIGTLAYTYTEQPPVGLTMHPNAAVWLCHMFPCCDSHPIETCPYNAEYRRRAEAWSRICRHLYIWHYIVDFAHYYNPFPNLRAMAADMRFYQRIGVESVFLQAMGDGGGGGEFSLLRGYYGMKLLWDPQADPQAIIDDFLQGYYGAAASAIGEYVKLLHDKVQDEDIHMHLYTNPAMGYLTYEVMAKASALFDEAQAAVAGDAELLERVKVARMPLDYAGSFPRNGYRVEGERLHFNGPFAGLGEVQEFIDRMGRHGFKTIREYGGEPEQLLMLGAMFHTGLEVVRLENDSMAAEVVPLLGGRLLRLIDKASGVCLTAQNVTRNLYFPFAGGIENRIGGLFEPTGWMEPALVTQRGPRELVWTAQTRDGLALTRQLRLDDKQAKLTLTCRIQNTKEQTVRTRLRSHAEWDLGTLRQTRVTFTDKAGRQTALDIAQMIAGLREGTHYHDEACPAGAWELAGTKGYRVLWTFEAAAVQSAWLYAYPEYLGQLEAELWSDEVSLAPGEQATLEQGFELRQD